MIKQLPKFLFCCVFVIVGIVISALGLNRCIKAQETHGWKKVNAELLTISLSEKERWSTDDDGNRTKRISRKLKPQYSYLYNGEKYIGKKVAFGINYSKVKVYEKLKDVRFILAYVNPQNPSESVLINKIDRNDVIIILIGFIWGGIVLAAMVGEFNLSSKIYYLILLVGIIAVYLCHYEFQWGHNSLVNFIEVLD